LKFLAIECDVDRLHFVQSEANAEHPQIHQRPENDLGCGAGTAPNVGENLYPLPLVIPHRKL